MTNLANRKSIDPRWTSWGLLPLSGFSNCLLAIYDPNIADTSDSFDPYSAETTSASVKLWEGMGQLSAFRQVLTADDVAGSVTMMRSIRFAIPLDGPTESVREGLLIRVLNCDHDHEVEKYEYTVTSGQGGALAWRRSIEATSNQRVVVTPITEA